MFFLQILIPTGLLYEQIGTALQDTDQTKLISILLIARQACHEGGHMFSSYSDWFKVCERERESERERKERGREREREREREGEEDQHCSLLECVWQYSSNCYTWKKTFDISSEVFD